MPQILVSPDSIQNSRFSVTGAEAYHLIRVLRAKVGDPIDIFDGHGRRFRAKIALITGTTVEGDIIEALASRDSGCRIHLYQGISKGAKMDYVIEKAVELGAAALTPFLSEKNIVKLDPKQADAKQKRWQALAKAASKQCNRADIPTVYTPQALKNISFEGLTLFLSVTEKKNSLKNILPVMGPDSAIINLVVGPESGFSAREEQVLIDKGALPVSLGERILRTETAGLVALSIVDYELGLF